MFRENSCKDNKDNRLDILESSQHTTVIFENIVIDFFLVHYLDLSDITDVVLFYKTTADSI